MSDQEFPAAAPSRSTPAPPRYRLIDRVATRRNDEFVDLLGGTEVYLALEIDPLLAALPAVEATPKAELPCPGFPDCECGKPHNADAAAVPPGAADAVPQTKRETIQQLANAIDPSGKITETHALVALAEAHRSDSEDRDRADAVPRKPQALLRQALDTILDLSGRLNWALYVQKPTGASDSPGVLAETDWQKAMNAVHASTTVSGALYEHLNAAAPAAPRDQTPTADELRALAAELRYVLRYTPANGPAPIAANKLAAWADRLALLAGKEPT